MDPIERAVGKAWHVARRASAICFAGLSTQPPYLCPICGFRGPFLTIRGRSASRRHGECPKCGAGERHRVQMLTLTRLPKRAMARARCLQFAPDAMTAPLRSLCREVVLADINPIPDGIQLDMRNMALPDASFGMVFASHVLEHIREDTKALAEVYRILAPDGFAILPVPVVADRTIEYPYAVATEDGHVRAPGYDYFERYAAIFDRVDILSSQDFPEEYQPWVWEDRTGFPNHWSPFRPAMDGTRHPEFVPICFKS